MSRHRATFDIDSKSDAYVVRILLEQVYDAVREETRDVREDDAGLNQTLQAFEAVRDAARRPAPGALTVVYDREDGGFDG